MPRVTAKGGHVKCMEKLIDRQEGQSEAKTGTEAELEWDEMA